MRAMGEYILSHLLHHANRVYSTSAFYAVKKKILDKYGVRIGFDVQFIEGKECFSCDGTGVYHKYYHGMWHGESCWNCTGGWYKLPVWNILYRVKFGQFIFHQPWQRVYKEPKDLQTTNKIEGYVQHSTSKYGHEAAFILFLLFEKGYLKRWWKETGNGWYTYPWRPHNFLSNCIHILKKRRNAICFTWKPRVTKRISSQPSSVPVEEDLPF